MDEDIHVIPAGVVRSWHDPVTAYLGVVSHDVIETGQEAQTGANFHVHRAVHVVEEVQGFVDQLAALLQKT